MSEVEEQFEILKKLFNVANDCELAPILDCTRQAIASAKHRGKISNRMLRAAAGKMGMTIVELKAHFPGSSGEKAGCLPQLPADAWNELVILVRENRELRQEIERLRQENAKLKGKNNL